MYGTRVGYPPLVTPFSQYVKNIALMNLLTIEQGKGRFVMMDDSMWGMILGKSGKIPGTIDQEAHRGSPRNRDVSSRMSIRIPCCLMHSMISVRRWMRMAGSMGRMTRSLFEPCHASGTVP